MIKFITKINKKKKLTTLLNIEQKQTNKLLEKKYI